MKCTISSFSAHSTREEEEQGEGEEGEEIANGAAEAAAANGTLSLLFSWRKQSYWNMWHKSKLLFLQLCAS